MIKKQGEKEQDYDIEGKAASLQPVKPQQWIFPSAIRSFHDHQNELMPLMWIFPDTQT
jgi:hypothetical protein